MDTDKIHAVGLEQFSPGEVGATLTYFGFQKIPHVAISLVNSLSSFVNP